MPPGGERRANRLPALPGRERAAVDEKSEFPRGLDEKKMRPGLLAPKEAPPADLKWRQGFRHAEGRQTPELEKRVFQEMRGGEVEGRVDSRLDRDKSAGGGFHRINRPEASPGGKEVERPQRREEQERRLSEALELPSAPLRRPGGSFSWSDAHSSRPPRGRGRGAAPFRAVRPAPQRFSRMPLTEPAPLANISASASEHPDQRPLNRHFPGRAEWKASPSSVLARTATSPPAPVPSFLPSVSAKSSRACRFWI